MAGRLASRPHVGDWPFFLGRTANFSVRAFVIFMAAPPLTQKGLDTTLPAQTSGR